MGGQLETEFKEAPCMHACNDQELWCSTYRTHTGTDIILDFSAALPSRMCNADQNIHILYRAFKMPYIRVGTEKIELP